MSILGFEPRPGGGFPPVLFEDRATVIPPSGGEPLEVVTGHAAVRDLLCSGAWPMASRGHPLTGAELQDPSGGLLAMDGEQLRRLRQVLNPLFTRQAAGRLRRHTAAIAEDLTSRLALVPGVVDVREWYAAPATSGVVSMALGTPLRDWPLLMEWSRLAFRVVPPGTGLDETQAAWAQIYRYYRRLLEHKRAAAVLDEGLVAQIHLAMSRAGYTPQQVARTVATVSNGFGAILPVLCVSLVCLLQRPRLLAHLLACGDREFPPWQSPWDDVVSHLLAHRALFPVALPRKAGPGAHLRGQPVPEGTQVLPSLVAAARQPGAPCGLAFGAGTHRCPGDWLALMALAEFLREFFTRFPQARLDGALEWDAGPLSSPVRIPVTLGGLAGEPG